MSIHLPSVGQTQFVSEVKHKFQEMGKLRNSVRYRDAKGVKTVQFAVMGRGIAAERNSIQTPIPVMNVEQTPVTVSVKNYTASELTDIFFNNQAGFDERSELVETIANALGRRLDQLVIESLAGASLTKAVAKNVSGANANMTLAALRKTAELMDKDGVPDAERTLVLNPSGLHALLAAAEVGSADYNNVKALVRGDLDTFYGFNIIKIGDRDEGGLPKSGTDRSNFAYHKSAIGLAVNMDVDVRIDWDEQYGAHRVTGFLSAGAGIIDAAGAVKITTQE